ncbi:MAG: 2-oxoglutarate and iron-dependent oxygenase domain-containing protein [Ilumatobacteraceae bacterium]
MIDLAAEAARLGAGGLGEYLATVYHEVGFAVVTGHGVPTEITDEAFAAARRFFELPAEQKETVDKRRSRHFRGWEATGVERTNNRPDIREQLDFWTEGIRPAARCRAPYLHLLGPNQWPSDDLAPGFAAAVQRWIYAAAELADRVMGLLSLGLGLDEDHLRRAFEDECMSLCKVINYPPASRPVRRERHHDAGFLCARRRRLPASGAELPPVSGSLSRTSRTGWSSTSARRSRRRQLLHWRRRTRVATPTRPSIAYFHGPSLGMPLVALRSHVRDAVAASPRHAAAGFMVQPDEVDAGAADMSSPHHPDRYGEQLWNYFVRSYPDNVKAHYG